MEVKDKEESFERVGEEPEIMNREVPKSNLPLLTFGHNKQISAERNPTNGSKIVLKIKTPIVKPQPEDSVTKQESSPRNKKEEESVIKLTPISKKKEDDLNKMNSYSHRYNRMIEKRKRQKDSNKRIKNKQGDDTYMRNTNLKKRITKVRKFWNGKVCFIPSVFFILKTEFERHGNIVEFNDFSLKGFNHSPDSVDQESDIINVSTAERDNLSINQ